jgi:hypothetical protein
MSPVIVVVVAILAAAVMWRAMAGGKRDQPSAERKRDIRPERRGKARIVPTRDKPAELQIIGQDFLEIPEVCDISDSGIAISVPHKFNGHKPTQEVELLLTLHGEGTVRARGAIRHVSYTRADTATFGVELVAIDETDRSKIRSYLAHVKQPQPSDDSAVPIPVLEPDPARGKK